MHFRIVVLLLLFQINLSAQTDNILFTIKGENITKDEFVRSYNKNNTNSIFENRDSIRHYLNQYIDFKLKVTEAKTKGYEKSKQFKTELEYYRQQLIQQHLNDKQTITRFASEAYERMKTEVRAKHILIKINPNASGKDSLIAYRKALNIKQKLLNGENFDKLAKKVSDDPSAINNGGDLWYVKPFKVPYELENYFYENNSPSKYSRPIRTKFGYHIVQILDKRKNPGRYQVAHIMLSLHKVEDEKLEKKVKKQIDSIHRLIINGEDFSKLAQRYSNDKGSSVNGGELPWFETGRMPNKFEEASFKLKKNGEVSKPVKTRYGWHIIKRLSHKEMPSYKQMEEQLIKKVSTGERGEIAKQKVIDQLKRKYQLKDYRKLSQINEIIDSTIYVSEWKIPEYKDLNEKVFSFDNQVYYQKDFASYIESNQEKMFPIPLSNYIKLKYKEFTNHVLLKYEEKKLEQENINLKSQLKEFKEGILYFDIMQSQVWTKASKDKNGMAEFYRKNNTHYNKLYEADICIFKYHGDNARKIEKQFKKFKKQNLNDSLIVLKIKKSADQSFELDACIKKEEGQHELVDKCIKKFKSKELKNDKKFISLKTDRRVVWVNNTIKKTNKPLSEIKGLVLSDYQKQTEKSWIKLLRKKYRVTINEAVFETLIKN